MRQKTQEGSVCKHFLSIYFCWQLCKSGQPSIWTLQPRLNEGRWRELTSFHLKLENTALDAFFEKRSNVHDVDISWGAVEIFAAVGLICWVGGGLVEERREETKEEVLRITSSTSHRQQDRIVVANFIITIIVSHCRQCILNAASYCDYY